MSDFDIVLIGCGAFARRYHVPALLGDREVRIVAIVDPFPAPEVRALAAATGAPIVARADELPDRGTPTAALVTTPHALHAAHVGEALARGWHVLCDKPFVLHLAEARALAAQAAARELVNAVAFNRRLDRGCLRAREIIRAGGIGAVAFVETVQLGYVSAGWFTDPALSGGGPFTGRGTHMADFVPWLVERAPRRLRARLRGGSPARIDQGGTIDLDFDGFEGRLTCVAEGWHMWDEVRVFGDAGLIELRRPLGNAIGWELRWHAKPGGRGETLAAEENFGAATRDFLAALRGGARPVCSFADALVSVAIVEEAFLSGRGDGGWRAVPAP